MHQDAAGGLLKMWRRIESSKLRTVIESCKSVTGLQFTNWNT